MATPGNVLTLFLTPHCFECEPSRNPAASAFLDMCRWRGSRRLRSKFRLWSADHDDCLRLSCRCTVCLRAGKPPAVRHLWSWSVPPKFDRLESPSLLLSSRLCTAFGLRLVIFRFGTDTYIVLSLNNVCPHTLAKFRSDNHYEVLLFAPFGLSCCFTHSPELTCEGWRFGNFELDAHPTTLS